MKWLIVDRLTWSGFCLCEISKFGSSAQNVLSEKNHRLQETVDEKL